MLFTGLLLLSSCTNDEQENLLIGNKDISSFLETPTYKWENTLRELGYDLNNNTESVVLVTGSSHCSSCLEELKFWNREIVNQEISEIVLVVVEKFEERYSNFLNQNNLKITSVRDGNGKLFSEDLIPLLPVKVLISEDGNIERIHSIGGDKFLANFLKDIGDIEVEIQRR